MLLVKIAFLMVGLAGAQFVPCVGDINRYMPFFTLRIFPANAHSRDGLIDVRDLSLILVVR